MNGVNPSTWSHDPVASYEATKAEMAAAGGLMEARANPLLNYIFASKFFTIRTWRST
jgi:hypothetical protein